MRHETKPDAILIAGPTASGKSALALSLAERMGALIINADSMQVYRDLRVLTARPSAEDEARMPHALYGTVDGATASSVSLWLSDAKAAIATAEAKGLIPLFVGGTGLYFKALTEGLSEIPSVPAPIREQWRAWAEGRPAADLHAELSGRDPVTAARLRPTDTQRLLRALEVHDATGESLSLFQARRQPAPLLGRRLDAYVLDLDRRILRDRVDRRLDIMVASGALDEVEHLCARRLDAALPVMRALGFPQLSRHIRGEVDLADALEDTKAATRAYLKRQATFFRNQLPGFRLIHPDRLADQIHANRQFV